MWHVGDEPVPGYRLESFLGRGSNAEVWRATAPGGTLVALKFIGLDRKLGLKEYRGIRRVKEIRHAHLLPIMACWILGQRGEVLEDCALDGEAEVAPPRDLPITGTLQIQPAYRDSPKTLVVAMLLGGRGLHEVLHERQQAGHEGIPADELLEYIEDAARGLDYLNSPRHDLGAGPVAIQHCDVKPQNILLVGDSAMVCDFGLARVLGGSDVCRTISGPAGTPAYVAPECIRTATPSPTSDQYSLAITYFELRTGRLPFAEESLAEVYAAHTRGQLLLDALPPGERRVIARATSLAPGQRYPSNMEMVRSLRRAVEEQCHFVSAAEAVASAAASAAPPPVAPDRAETELPDAEAHQDKEGRRTTDTVTPSESTSLDGLGPPADWVGVGEVEPPGDRPMQTYAIEFEPASAEVAFDGIRQQLDAEGRVEIRAHAEARIDVSATAPGFEAFRKRLAVAALEWPAAKIVLQRDARALVDRGVAQLKEGNVDAAIAAFDEAIDLAPDMAEAYYGRAMAHGATPEHRRDCAAAFNEQAHEEFARGEYHRAVADFTKALELNPELAKLDRCRLLRNRALAYRKQGLFAEAIADYGRVIGCCSDFAKVYRDRAAAYWDKGDHDRAIADYAEAMRLAADATAVGEYRRDCGAAYRARGDLHWQKGDAVRALADYEEAIRLRPDWGIAYNQRGRVRAAGRDFDGAMADYSRAIELDPEYAHLYLYNRGSARLASGDGRGAVADLTAAVELKPDYRRAYVRRSEAYKALGMEAEAGDDVLRAKALE